MSEEHVELAPFSGRGRGLAGFVLCNRWPDSTREWGEALSLVVRLAAVPGMVNTSTVFHTSDETPEVSGDLPNPVGLMIVDGPVVGDTAVAPGTISGPTPHAAMLLHPPTQDHGPAEASGCVLLPGLPHLGLAHRAVWVAAQADGTVTKLVSDEEADVQKHPDTAVLAMLIAA